jgi:outer membrane protein assembly factor BamD (BamD/ComL family)
MFAAEPTRLAAAACLCAALFGCTWSHQATAETAPGQAVYDPPVPVSQVPSGEPRPDPVTGIDRYAPKNFAETMKESFGRGPNEAVARGYYAEADELYRKRSYHDAAKKYEAAADRLPDSSLEESALFMSGEAHFFADEYSKAEDQYEALVKKYTNSRMLNIVVLRQYAIGVYWLQYDRASPHWMLTPNFNDPKRPSFDTFGYAIRCFDNVRINDPRGRLADEAIWNTANAYFVKGHWDDADYYYKLIRTDYPKSPHQKDAHLLGIQVKFKRYQGPTYDDRPLKDAEKLIDQTVAQFGSELGGERDHLMTAKAEIHAQLALRYWTLAQFYEKGQYYRAARIYYADLIQQYPQTQLAQASRERMTAIKDLPGYPADHFYLLAELFDGKDPNKERADREGPTATMQPMVATQPDPNAPAQR